MSSATGRSRWRSTATATASASIGSDSRCAGPAPHASHQPGRDPHHPLAGTEQVGLQPPGQVAAVLERVRHLLESGRQVSSCRCPSVLARRVHSPIGRADVVDHDEGVGALVGVGADHHHRRGPFARYWQGRPGPRVSRARLNPARAGSYQATSRPTGGRPAEPHIGLAANDEAVAAAKKRGDPTGPHQRGNDARIGRGRIQDLVRPGAADAPHARDRPDAGRHRSWCPAGHRRRSRPARPSCAKSSAPRAGRPPA